MNKYNGQHVDLAVFDLDGTLIKEDSLVVQIKTLYKLSFFHLVKALITLLLYGRIKFKSNMHDIIQKIDLQNRWLDSISIDDKILEALRNHELKQHQIIIATAAYRETAINILDKFDLHITLIATTAEANLKGISKILALEPYTKNKCWVYYGDSRDDTPLFEAADFYYKVNR